MTIIVPLISSSSSRDYTWLRDTAVPGWLHRSDLASQIPDFVMLAEKQINDDLQARLANTSTTLTTTADVATVTLPSDFLSVKSLSVDTLGKLTYMTPSQLEARYAGVTGLPSNFTIQGRTLKLGPTPDAAYTLNLLYQGGVPALADSGGTNWLIEQRADVYLAATMVQACIYTRNEPELAKWTGKYSAALGGLNTTDWNSAGSMVVRPDARTP